MKFLLLSLFALLLCPSNPAGAREIAGPVFAPASVTWKSLIYQTRSFLGTATAVVKFDTRRQPDFPPEPAGSHSTSSGPGAGDVPAQNRGGFCLSLTNTIKPHLSVPRFYQARVWFSPENCQAIRRLRLLRGKSNYLKDYLFTPAGVYRYRKKPADSTEETFKPELWTDSEKTFYPLPGSLSAATIISEPLLILYYLSAKAAEAKPAEICVFHKKQYFRLKLIRKAPVPIQVDYIEQYNAQKRRRQKGEMELSGYRLISRPLAGNAAKVAEKFSFMGLTGAIIIYFNEKSRLPLRLDGDIPFIGRVYFNLRKAVMTNLK